MNEAVESLVRAHLAGVAPLQSYYSKMCYVRSFDSCTLRSTHVVVDAAFWDERSASLRWDKVIRAFALFCVQPPTARRLRQETVAYNLLRARASTINRMR